MYPHERSLVARLKDQPFALLGVNSDKDREAVREIVKQENLTWRSWYDGGLGGPIARQWGVNAWPTLYVIDHRGVIRHQFIGGPPPEVLDKAVESLLEEIGDEPEP